MQLLPMFAVSNAPEENRELITKVVSFTLMPDAIRKMSHDDLHTVISTLDQVREVLQEVLIATLLLQEMAVEQCAPMCEAEKRDSGHTPTVDTEGHC